MNSAVISRATKIKNVHDDNISFSGLLGPGEEAQY